MHVTTDNLLTVIKMLVTGGGRNVNGTPYNSSGIQRDVPVPLSAVDLNTTRAVNTSDAGAAADPVVETGAYLAADETNARVVHVDEGTDTIGHLTFPIPRDYDEGVDELKLHVLASMVSVSTDDDVELDSEAYVKTAATALGSDLDPTAPGTVLSTTEQWITIDLSQNELTRDDVVNLKLITNGANDTNGEEVLIHALKLTYRSTIVSYDQLDADENSLR